jgi:Fe(II)/alpha-ketoglutarate-dependent arginine beta-hydroxylase
MQNVYSASHSSPSQHLNMQKDPEASDHPREFTFSEWEIQATLDEVHLLCQKFPSVESTDFVHDCEVASGRISKRLRDILLRMRNGSSRAGFFLIKGYQVDDDRIGPSPSHWDAMWEKPAYLREEVYQCLISSVLGSIFGWRTQENGRFLRHIVPIDADRNEQLGGSSETTLLWHTEEAFHPARADFLTLMCYRNNEKAETMLVSIDDIRLDQQTIATLKQKRFIIEPDKSHLPTNNQSAHWQLEQSKFQKIHDILANPQPCAVIFGPDDQPFIRVDQAFMKPLPGDSQAEMALDALHREFDRRATRVIMQPGDFLVIDNALVAHGRTIYTPDYGPKQRWLRRTNVSTGWRHHASFRESFHSRAMV